MKDLLDDVMGYSLDDEQRRVVYDNSKYTIVIAGAGSGKTLTIIGKIRYLVEIKKINIKDILCISFTKEASNSLKTKLKDYYNYDMDVYTFHKLSLKIIKDNSTINYNITPSNLLEYISCEYFYSLIKTNNTSIKRVLKYFNKRNIINIMESYNNLLINNKEDIYILIKEIVRFINLFKGSGLTIKDFYKIYYENNNECWFKTKYKNNLFLKIAFDIYLIYQEEIKSTSSLDFDDMIILATNIVKNNYNRCYKYIIIDEYQDTNLIRFNLVYELLNKTNANLLVVGDDFQSIYGFNGCDLSMFLNFSSHFDNVSVYKITNTYRNSQELNNIAGKFIMKNDLQIKKDLKSIKQIDYPIEVCYESSRRVLKKLLNKLGGNTLILSRNSFDINSYLDDELRIDKDGYINYNNLDNIRYLTVHKSKGLESDNVIIINVVNSVLGFPNNLDNNKVFSFLLNNDYDNEERRLFYVALTRTKNKVYILSNKNNPSRYILELKNDLKVFTYNEL